MSSWPVPWLDPSFPLPLGAPFTRVQARSVGIADKQLHVLTKRGHLRRPVRGVYVAGQLPDSLQLRCQILRLAVPAGAFICDRTAAWLHAGPGALGPNEHLAVPLVSCFRPSDSRRLRTCLARSGERAVVASDLEELHGLLVTTTLRTALDLGRLGGNHDLRLWGMDQMLGLRQFTPEELNGEIPRFKGQRGVVGLRHLAPLADGGAQSMGETALRLRCYAAGLPRPTTQIEVPRACGSSYWLDMGLPELRFAAEYDGVEWHSSDAQVRHDAARRLELREEQWLVEVFRKENVFGRTQDAEQRLAAAYRHARSTQGNRTWFV